MMVTRSPSRSDAAKGRLVGYARVSTGQQTTNPQIDALDAIGCISIFQDVASGADTGRPELKRCLSSLVRGDTLVVARFDRLGRSVVHLNQTVQDLKARGVFFRSLAVSFDTSTPEGELIMVVLSGIAQFERQLIRSRTMAGQEAARRRGAVFGNPRMIARDPVTIGTMKANLAETYLARARAEAAPWRNLVQLYRPELTWKQVLKIINERHYKDRRQLRLDTFRRHVQRLVDAGDLPHSVLQTATSPKNDTARIVAHRMLAEDPSLSLRALGQRMDESGISPPHAAKWSAQTVKRLIDHEVDLSG